MLAPWLVLLFVSCMGGVDEVIDGAEYFPLASFSNCVVHLSQLNISMATGEGANGEASAFSSLRLLLRP